MSENWEHATLDGRRHLGNEIDFRLFLAVKSSALTVLVQLASEHTNLIGELDDSVGEELEPLKASLFSQHSKIHVCTLGDGVIKGL
jgi:hypothetical protein